MKALLRPPSRDAIRNGGDLFNRQYGWRQGRSTVGEVRGVSTQEFYCTHGSRTKISTVIRGHCTGLSGGYFWGVLIDGLLKMALGEGITLVVYVDDTIAIIVAPDLNTAQMKTEIMMRKVACWMEEHGLQLSLTKAEIVILSGRRIETIEPIRISDQVIESKPSAVYLGVTIDTKLTFAEHFQKATEKASIWVGELSQLMANTRGPRLQARWLLMSTIHSILLYSAEVWADAMMVQKYRHGMEVVQKRGALRSLNCLEACGPGHHERSADRPPRVRAIAYV